MHERHDPPVVARVRTIVDEIASDLDLDVYDIEQRGSTLRVTLDTMPGSDGGVSLDQLTLATRLLNRELDHQDPVPGRYTLEVSSPGVERNLRLPRHFEREIGKRVAIRLAGVDAAARRVNGTLVAADADTATIRLDDEPGDVQVIAIDSIDRARTVFEWGPTPKPSDARKAKKSRTKPGGTTDDRPQVPSPPPSDVTVEPASGEDKETS